MKYIIIILIYLLFSCITNNTEEGSYFDPKAALIIRYDSTDKTKCDNVTIIQWENQATYACISDAYINSEDMIKSFLNKTEGD